MLNRIAYGSLPEKPYGTTATKNNLSGEEKEAIYLWVPSLMGQNPPHGTVMPCNLQVVYLTTLGSQWGSQSTRDSSRVRPCVGAAVAPMTVDGTEVVLTPGPEPQGEPGASRAGRYSGQGYNHWNEVSHFWGQGGHKIWQAA